MNGMSETFWYLIMQLMCAVLIVGIPLGFIFLWAKYAIVPMKIGNPSFDTLEFINTFFFAGITTIVSILVWVAI